MDLTERIVSMIIPLPETWNEWKITEKIGSGSYGSVYRAEKKSDPTIESAIKIINLPMDDTEKEQVGREYKNNDEFIRGHYKEVAERFLREVDAMQELKDCPFIVQYQDCCIGENRRDPNGLTIYIRMEKLTSFYDYACFHEMIEARVIDLGLNIGTALSECHKHGILHRDIKQENVLVTEDGQFKLGDFGFAKDLRKTSQLSLSMKGTVGYMAPEIYVGGNYDNRADIYSFGLLMYKLVNEGRDPLSNMDKQILSLKDKEDAFNQRMAGAELPPPTRASEELSEILLHACQFNPEDRYETIDEMLRDLKLLKRGEYKLRKIRIKNNKRKKLLKKIIPLVTVVAIATCMGGKAMYTNYNTVDRGSCGEDASWKIYRDGSLIIEGTGAAEASDEMNEYTSFVKTIEVKEGITELGREALCDFVATTDIILPDSLESFGDSVFTNCNSLENVNIPDGITKIPMETFSSTGIKEIEIPDSVTEIGERAFFNSDLESIAIPNSVVVIEEDAFGVCKQLKSATLPERLLEIKTNTFFGCDNLSQIIIPEKVEFIDDAAFAACLSLETIEIPEAVEGIGAGAFQSCKSLKNVILPEYITVAEDAFLDTPWGDSQ